MLEEFKLKRKFDSSQSLRRELIVSKMLKKIKIRKISPVTSLKRILNISTFKTKVNIYSLSSFNKEHNMEFEVSSNANTLSKSTTSIINDNNFTDDSFIKNKNNLINHIISLRKNSAVIISAFLKRKLFLIKYRRNLIIQHIGKKLIFYIIKIQSRVRGFLLKKHFNIIMKSDYLFIYQLNKMIFHKKTDENIKIILRLYSKNKVKHDFILSYSKYLKSYYLPLIKSRPIKKDYKVNFIINDNIIIDPAYPVDYDNGNFYNVIKKGMLKCFTFNKKGKSGFWENMLESKKFIRSNSYDSISLSNSSVSYEPFYYIAKTKVELKPILKPNHKSSFKARQKERKVSFSGSIQYSY